MTRHTLTLAQEQWLRAEGPQERPTKEQAPCCQAKALPDGRPCIGYCGPNCLRRR